MDVIYRDVVSRVQQNFNSADKDMFIPRRLILHVFKSKAEFFLLQKLNEKKLYQNSDIFQWLNCIELEEVPKSQCEIKGFSDCERIMRSKKKLPDILNTDYGYAILSATNINHSKEYEIKSYNYYNKLKNREHFDFFKGKYLYIINNYLYAPDSEKRLVNMLVFSIDERCEEYSECDKDGGKCTNYWDKKIRIPRQYYELAFQETLKELSTRLSIPKDENPDLDSNQKSATIG